MARKSKRVRRTAARVIVCPRCDKTKPVSARGICHACYQRYRRKGIVHRAGDLSPLNPGNRPFTPDELATMKKLRTAGKTCREVAAALPGRTFLSVRYVCVERGYVRGGDAAELARLDRLIEEQRKTLPEVKQGRPKK